jgi:hypothetical protein
LKPRNIDLPAIHTRINEAIQKKKGMHISFKLFPNNRFTPLSSPSPLLYLDENPKMRAILFTPIKTIKVYTQDILDVGWSVYFCHWRGT